MRVMIVDDHSGVREMIRSLICTSQDEVCECATADEAVKQSAEFRPDFVTMDLWMPGLNSFKGIQGILQASPASRVVVVTAYDQRGLRDAAAEAGAIDYLLKDNLSALRAVIRPELIQPPATASATTTIPAGDTDSLVRSPIERLEARVEELESFPSFVASEMRVPFRAIENFAAILQRQPASADQVQACVNRIQAVCRQMDQRMNALQSFFEKGRRAIQWQAVDLNALVRDCWEEVVGGVPTSVQFRQFRLPTVPGDAVLLQLVFRNLLDNALKFCAGRPDPTVEVSCCAAGQYAVFAIVDNGVGFDMRHAARLFMPLGRLHSADHYAGTGLGLALAQKIVHQHGGRIWAEGRVNEGATFYFTLPLQRTVEPVAETAKTR